MSLLHKVILITLCLLSPLFAQAEFNFYDQYIMSKEHANQPKSEKDMVHKFQVMLIKDMFLNRALGSDISFLNDEDQEAFGSSTMLKMQNNMIIDAIAENLAENDALGLRKILSQQLEQAEGAASSLRR